MLLYVNDMLSVGKSVSRIDRLKKKLSESFAMKDIGAAKQIHGIRIIHHRQAKKLWLLQEHYRFHKENAKVVSTSLTTHFKLSYKHSLSNEAEKTNMSRVLYASIVGSLMYAMLCTRLDIAHIVDIVESIEILYLHGTSDLRLCFGGDMPTLVRYSNSDMAGNIDFRKFTSGYLIKFTGGVVAWQSKLKACKELLWVKKFLQELGFVQDKYLLFCDSQSVIHLGKNSTFHSKSKHIDICDALYAKLLELAKVHTNDNGANMMTKTLSREKFKTCYEIIGLSP
ncbi:hypothetical protein CR513_06047, partial [Mucuna pruriens]